MADVDSPEGAAPAEPKGKGSSSKVILISTIVFIQVVAAITLVVFVILPKYQEVAAEPGATEETVAEESEAEEAEEAPKELGQIYKVSDLTVNPKGSMGRRFAIFEVALEVETAEDVEVLKRFHPLIVDGYINYLRTKTVFELATDDSLTVIKNHLKDITNTVIGQDLVYNIYFTRFVLQ